MDLQDKKENIIQRFYDAIDEIDKCDILRNELQCLAEVLGGNSELFKEFDVDNQNPELERKLDNLDKLLNNILNKIKSLNASLFGSFAQNDPAESILSDITETANDIFKLLKDIGINNPYNLQPENFSQAYARVFDLLDECIDDFQKRKKKIRTKLNQCSSNNRLNLKKESTREILKRNKKYELDPNDFKTGDRLYYSTEHYNYYKGTNNISQEKVTLMKLSENTYLGRILDVLSQMKNEGVEKFFGFFYENREDEEKEPKVTIVTQRVGVDLFTFLHSTERRNNGYKFKAGDRTILAFKIAKAMSYVHSRNVIHRNLVPSSVYINRKDENEDFDVMVAGFRNSRIMPDTPRSNMTNSNLIFDSTPTNFFAPEFDNNSQYDEKIDVFSFSGIIYEFATGKMPYSDKSDEEAKRLLEAGERPDLKGISPELSDLIEKCWKQDPNYRYSFNEIVNKMAQNKIIFDQDKKKEEYIKDFYVKNTSNREIITTAVELIESIKNDIIKSCQYRHGLFRTRSTLNYYQFFLNHNYKASENDSKRIDNIISILKDYKSVVENTLPNKWNSIASKLEVSEITENINRLMLKLNESMKEIGYTGESYQESNDDMIFDYRELYITFETDKKFENVSSVKRKEIVEYLKKKGS